MVFQPIIAGLGTAGGLFVFEKLAGWTTDAVQGFSNLSSAMKMLNAGSLGAEEFQKLLTLTDGLSKSQTKLILSYTSLSDAQKIRSNEDALINEVEKEWVIRNGQILEFNDGYPTKATVQ